MREKKPWYDDVYCVQKGKVCKWGPSPRLLTPGANASKPKHGGD